jgi:DNA-binding XRE family transcriptional regulator
MWLMLLEFTVDSYFLLLHDVHMQTVKASKAKNPEQERVGRTLHVLRERFGYTQESLAKELGVSRAYVSLIESGAKPLQDRLLKRVADVLEITPLAIKRYDHEADLALAA